MLVVTVRCAPTQEQFLAMSTVYAQGTDSTPAATESAANTDKYISTNEDQVLATTTLEQKGLAETAEILDAILKVMYLLLWPLLFIAGIAMDNTLVLGEVFHLDAALWKFWQMMTTFANFALAGIVMFEIGKFLFGSTKDSKEIVTILKKALIAGVGIQASRFATIALLDISTVMIYAVGAMPINAMSQTSSSERIVLETNSVFDLTKEQNKNDISTDDAFYVTYSCPNLQENLGICHVKNNYIIGAVQPAGATNISSQYCVLGGSSIKNNVVKLTNNGNPACIQMHENTGQAPTECDAKTVVAASQDINDRFVTEQEAQKRGCQSVAAILGDTKGFVKPLVTLYSSLLDFTNFNLADNQISTGALMIMFLIKVLVGIALLTPLVALAAVMVVRAGRMRLVLCAGPILVVKNVFFEKVNILGDRDSFEEIIKMIFLPVGAVFALSMGLMVISTISTQFAPEFGQTTAVQDAFGITSVPNADSVDMVNGLTTIRIKTPQESYGLSLFLDYFNYLFINLFAIGVMWMVFFAAMKLSKSLSEKISDKIEKGGRDIMGSLPVVPIPGTGAKIGVGTLFGSGYDSLLGKAQSKVREKQRLVRDDAFQQIFGGGEGGESLSKKQIDTITSNYHNNPATGIRQAVAGAVDDASTVDGHAADPKVAQAIAAAAKGDKAKQQQLANDVLKLVKGAGSVTAATNIANARSGGVMPQSLTAPKDGESKTIDVSFGDTKAKIRRDTANKKITVEAEQKNDTNQTTTKDRKDDNTKNNQQGQTTPEGKIATAALQSGTSIAQAVTSVTGKPTKNTNYINDKIVNEINTALGTDTTARSSFANKIIADVQEQAKELSATQAQITRILNHRSKNFSDELKSKQQNTIITISGVNYVFVIGADNKVTLTPHNTTTTNTTNS